MFIYVAAVTLSCIGICTLLGWDENKLRELVTKEPDKNMISLHDDFDDESRYEILDDIPEVSETDEVRANYISYMCFSHDQFLISKL